MTKSKRLHAEKIFQTFGPVIRAGELREHNLFSRDLFDLIENGDILRIKAGYYIWNAAVHTVSDIVIANTLIPFGIICLQSAAQFHELTTLNPLTVTVAIPANRTRVALPEFPPIELVSYPLPTFELGIKEMKTGESKIHIYDRERTVCDFFRKRKQVGEDLTLDILQTYMRGSRNMQRLFEYAGMLRIKSIMRPYLEALI